MKTLAFFPVLILLVLSSFSLPAQQAGWYKGVAYLNNNEVVSGKLSYDPELKLLQCKSDGVVKVFAPHKVKLFQYYDDELACNKVFASYDNPVAEGGRLKSFYEVVLTGKITLLRADPKIRVKQVSVKPGPEAGVKAPAFSTYVETTVYNYYFLYEDRLLKVDNFKDELKSLLEQSPVDFDAFIADHNLNLKDIYDVVKIISHYNEASKQQSLILL